MSSEVLLEKKEVELSIPIKILLSDDKKKLIPVSYDAIIKKDEKTGKLIFDKLILNRIKLKTFQKITETSDLPLKTHLIVASSQLPLEIIEEIDLNDLYTIMEALEPFLPLILQTINK